MTQPNPPFDVKAIAAYTARNDTEVSLEVGKVYRVISTDGRGLWWQTTKEDGRNVGWFPASYTEVQTSAAPVVPTPAPQISQQYSQPSSFTSQSSSHGASSVSMTATSSDRPKPLKTTVENLGKNPTPPCSVMVHIIEAKDLMGVPPSKMQPCAFVYKREVMQDSKKAKPLFSLITKNKTNAPNWNEECKLYIKDAELEVVCIRFCAKNDWKAKGNYLIGEIEFPLRGAVRKFDKPNGQFQWFPIKGGNNKDKVGEALLFIEFEDTRASEGPKNVKHEGHVGISAGGGFEIRDIPAEWKQLFRVLNIKKKDLESNPEMAKEVLNIMHEAASNGSIASTVQANSVTTTVQTPVATPAPTPVVTATAAPPPPPPPASTTAKTPPPPPPPTANKPAPAVTGPPPAPTPSAPTPSTPTPSAPTPPAPTPVSPAPTGNSLFDQIKGGVKLKKAEIAEVEKGTASTGNVLADTLISAMSKYRADITGNDKADDEDDWSE